jgi:hypothetical protein
MMGQVALVIIYNHRYDRNIDIIENIYKARFSYIYHLIPFYNGVKSNVIPVYDNSLYFQGYLAQGLSKYYKSDFENYVFIADDLLLNPRINEGNYKDYFNLGLGTSFISNIISLHEMKHFWPRIREAFDFRIKIRGLEIENELPGYWEALERFKYFNLQIKALGYKQLVRQPGSTFKSWVKFLSNRNQDLKLYISGKILGRTFNLRYPLAGSYSDICIISSDSIRAFCHFCGVFAAARLHVEIAIPTSLILSASYIITEKNLRLRGKALWPDGWNRLHGENDLAYNDYEELKPFNNSLYTLLNNFPEGYLYLHPIKLSKWTL